MTDPDWYYRRQAPKARRDRTVEVLIVSMSGLEVLTLYLLLTSESPLGLFARRATETVGGTIKLVLLVLWVVCVITAVVWFMLGMLRTRAYSRLWL